MLDREVLVQTGALIAACTAALTAAFVGVVALLAGQSGLLTRLPLYVLVGAVTFVGVLLAADHRRNSGQTVLVRAVVVAAAGFVLFGLGAEGVLYAATRPGEVVASHLFAYLVSAAIIASGLGYWGARNWREVSRAIDRSL